MGYRDAGKSLFEASDANDGIVNFGPGFSYPFMHPKGFT